tara:strand:- start:761 stop:2305 length:1545 start_codon:yes stop_codon:yes gene_type:complete
MVDLFRPLFYDKDKYKIIPDKIINGNYNVRLNFFLGYYFADGSKCRNTNVKNISFDNKGKIGSSQLYYLVKSLNYDASIRIRKDKPNIYIISCCCLRTYKNKQRLKSNVIKKIEHLKNINDDVYVYDLETEEGIFNGGIGEIVVKNTDSVFIKFDTDNLEEAISLGKEAGKKVTDYLISENRKPHDLEYEKTFYPFILFSKKRYVGNKYEEDINKFSQTSMGIVLKRRDNAKILKNIYQGIINTILNEKNIEKALDFFKNSLNRIEDFKFDKLVISKTLKGNYKNPTSIAHKVLADRIKDRDPGNAPATNDRIPYIYVDVKTLKCNNCNKSGIELHKCIKCLKLYGNCKLSNKFKMHKEDDYINDCFHNHECQIICRFCHIKLDDNHKPCKISGGYFCKKCKDHNIQNLLSTKLLQGDRIEHPDYLQENPDIKPDFEYYFDHQIRKPVEQIFELAKKKEEFEEIIYSKYEHKRPKKDKEYVNIPLYNFKKKNKSEQQSNTMELSSDHPFVKKFY